MKRCFEESWKLPSSPFCW